MLLILQNNSIVVLLVIARQSVYFPDTNLHLSPLSRCFSRNFCTTTVHVARVFLNLKLVECSRAKFYHRHLGQF